jgi:hypothetical protein
MAFPLSAFCGGTPKEWHGAAPHLEVNRYRFIIIMRTAKFEAARRPLAESGLRHFAANARQARPNAPGDAEGAFTA